MSNNADLFSENPTATCGTLEQWAQAHGYRCIAGVDEVGRGPLAGPVVAAAVVLPEQHGICGLADSKQLSESKRKSLRDEISHKATAVGVGEVSPQQIDQSNIRLASLEAMRMALAEVLRSGTKPDVVLVDGRDVCPLPENSQAIRVKAFVKGDQRSQAIAAASIVAKVYRDQLMLAYHATYPQYGFDKHKGYPTAHHRNALLEHGPCPIHRRSFRGVLPQV